MKQKQPSLDIGYQDPQAVEDSVNGKTETRSGPRQILGIEGSRLRRFLVYSRTYIQSGIPVMHFWLDFLVPSLLPRSDGGNTFIPLNDPFGVQGRVLSVLMRIEYANVGRWIHLAIPMSDQDIRAESRTPTIRLV
jgi:hypothetical protein